MHLVAGGKAMTFIIVCHAHMDMRPFSVEHKVRRWIMCVFGSMESFRLTVAMAT